MSDKVRNDNQTTVFNPSKTTAFDAYITFRALGGMMVDDTGNLSAMKLKDFYEEYDVDARTVYRWKQTPNLSTLIRQRRDEVVPLARETAALNRMFLIGMSSIGGNALHRDQRSAIQALTTYLGHHGNLQLPVQRQDITIQGGLADVLTAAATDGIIEGEIIEPSPIDAGTGDQDTSALPPAP